MWGVEWAVVLAMILCNSVFAAYEIALASVALARLEVLVREKRPGAKAALEMKERMEASLAVVQVGITLVGAIGAAASGAGALEMICAVVSAPGRHARPGGVLRHRDRGHTAQRRDDRVRRIGAQGFRAAEQGVGLPAAVARHALVRVLRLAGGLAV